MRLNQDCVRSLLLELEGKLDLNEHLHLSQIKELDTTQKYGEDTTIYAILKLIEAEYLLGSANYASNQLYHLGISALSWNGHQFLDTVRDNKVWEETKNIVSKFSSVSLSLISSIASNVINELIKKQLGLL